MGKDHDPCDCKHECTCSSDCDSEAGFCHVIRCSKLSRGLLVALAAVGAVALLVLVTVFIIWLVLQPKSPRFALQDLTVSQFNLTGPPGNCLTAVVRTTVAFRNPNGRVGIYFDRYRFYVTYANQQITASTGAAGQYEGHNDVALWTFDLVGCDVPVAPYLYEAILRDKCAGYILLTVKMEARIRWKVGSWTSGRYGLTVSCPAFLSFGDVGGQATLQFHQASKCYVSL